MKYKNLTKLAEAFKSGELKGYKLILDNDNSFLSYVGKLPEGMRRGTEKAEIWLDKKREEADKLYRGNGYSDLQEALEAAGIPCEWC
jgi:hypothetical protein